MTMRDEIETKLRESFDPAHLSVVDDSASHAGHAGAPAGGESHFIVHMTATAFEGQSRIARHRAVHSALGAEIMGRIHALALHLSV